MYYSKAQNHFFYEKNDENILYIRAEKKIIQSMTTRLNVIS